MRPNLKNMNFVLVWNFEDFLVLMKAIFGGKKSKMDG